MDYATKKELESIVEELESISKTLDNVAEGIDKEFKGISQNLYSRKLRRNASKYRAVKIDLLNIK